MLPADALDQSPEATFRAMVDSVMARVRGCCGCGAELRLGSETVVGVCSHPDLTDLMHDLSPAASPVLVAAAGGQPVVIDDTLLDLTFPEFSARALHRGLRSVVCATRPVEAGVLVCTLYSLRAGGMPAGTPVVMDGVLAEWSDLLARTTAYAGVRTEAHHLTEAIAAKEFIEQAKGMLMHALRCDSDAAYAELQNTARRAKIRTADMARRMVEHRPAGSRGQIPPSPAHRKPQTAH